MAEEEKTNEKQETEETVEEKPDTEEKQQDGMSISEETDRKSVV